ncbi:MAG: N-acetyltransferase [Gammaproteobacteria bacterium]|jgi:N-acetylglutamate synthase-like GNAT family acetyltransferase|nr:N-acetyltransferase [Gammaproteobacteria bacterium]
MRQLSYLADYQHYIPLLAKHLYHQFSYFNPAYTLDSYEEELAHQCNYSQLPITYIVQQNNTVLGTASLYLNDLNSHQHLVPWLANVYTFEAYRKQGVGAYLVEQVVLQAKSLGFDKLYLFTDDKAEWYQKLGWHSVDHSVLKGIPIVIMKYDLIPSSLMKAP